MAFKNAKDIFDEKDREERKKEMQDIGKWFNTLMLNGKMTMHPTTEKKLQEFIEWDTNNKKEEAERRKRYQNLGYILGILIFITMVLGCVWLIKFFIGRIF